MNRLEERYRRVLRLLPAEYRRTWEDDMVAALLESMATDDPEEAAFLADHGRPRPGEVASVVRLAVRLRLGGTGRPRSLAWGAAVRLAVLMATLTAAASAAFGLALAVWLSGRIGWLPAPPPAGDLPAPAGQWRTAWELLGNAWLPAYLALVWGQRRIAQALALLAVLPGAVGAAVAQLSGAMPPQITPWAFLLADLAVIGAMAAFGPDAPPVARRSWLVALPVCLVLLAVPPLAAQAAGGYWVYLDWPGMCCALVTAAMLIHLAVGAWRGSRPAVAWSLALALLAGVAAALRLATLLDQYVQVAGVEMVAVGLGQLVVVSAVGVPVAARAGQALRRLPAQRLTAPDGPVG